MTGTHHDSTAAEAGNLSARGPGPRAWLELVRAESRMVVRDTAGLLIPLGLPLLILVMNGMGAAGEPLPELSGLTPLDVYVLPLVLTIVMSTIGVINMPSFLAYYRKSGILRRLSVTPAHPAMVLVAQLVISVAQTAVGITLCLLAGMLWFDLSLPHDVLGALGVLGLTAAAMYAVGMLIAALSPTPNSSVAIGLVTFFALGATGGLFGGTSTLPEPVAQVGEVLPFGAAVQAMGGAWAGAGPEAAHLLSQVVTVLVCGVLSARLFRWQ
ncbi:ABC transporter [Saccharomonospora piscinae]|uniref:ABC transporter n=1 Tax=Saccharomonospora piscinae TaxID=687388 RepID=A0A1V9A7M0_SACPI|nr:ABC transporter permease [Saccharomonospora piscinae]OQO92924.1 ABC transporter [Saccharomonospora piscinae]